MTFNISISKVTVNSKNVIDYSLNCSRSHRSSNVDIDITITGTNDAPVVSGPVTDTTNDQAAPLTVDLLANASDVDAGGTLGDDLDVASVSITGLVDGSTAWAETIDYTVDPETGELVIDPTQFNSLDETQTLVLTVNYNVVDEAGAVTPATATVTVNGTNDAPYVVGTTGLEDSVTEIEDGEKVTFTAEVDVRPEFELPDYKAITVEVDAAEANDADIDEHIDNLRTRFASLKDVDRACADGDVLLVDIAGSTDSGDDVDDLSGNAMSYEMGTDGMLPGFDDAVRGASAGETRTFPFTPSNGDWAGVPLTVTATVTAVRERELPALDEEFVTMASEFDTVDELREDARTRVGRLKRMEQGQQAREKVNEALMASVDIPVPEGVIAAEVDVHFEDGHEASDEQRAEIEQQSREALKRQFILDRIAEVEEVSVGESELSNWLMQQAPRYGMAPDALAQALVESGQVSMALSDIRRSKALALVLENATVTDSNGDAVDLQALESELNEAMQAAQMAQLQAQMAAAESGQ